MKNFKFERKYKIRLILIIMAPLIWILNSFIARYPKILEEFYSTGINKITIEILSNITNKIPISLYELTLIGTFLIFIFSLIKVIVKIYKDTDKVYKIIIDFIINIFTSLAVIYILFMALWGFNYNRVNFNKTYGFSNNKHSLNELAGLYEYLVIQANDIRADIDIERNSEKISKDNYMDIFNRAEKGYEIASNKFKTLEGNYGSPKKLLFSNIFTKAGITGIYFPFSGQPGVNIDVPLITLPATTIHEMAHQRGYAQEDEANFIAFIVCSMHQDLDFQYSGYLLALSYTGNAIYKEDPELLKELQVKLSEEVKADMRYKNNFFIEKEGKIYNVANNINDTFLKSNGVKDGDKSYGRVVDLILNYYIENIK